MSAAIATNRRKPFVTINAQLGMRLTLVNDGGTPAYMPASENRARLKEKNVGGLPGIAAAAMQMLAQRTG
jgi:hypothetical protein